MRFTEFRKFVLAASLCACSGLLLLGQSGLMKPVQLTCDWLTTPLGIDSKQPVFSWKLQDSRFGARQSAYQIQVASDPKSFSAAEADVWDGGRVASGKSVGVPYRMICPRAPTHSKWR